MEQEATRYVSYFQRPTYQTVLSGRPLVFVLGSDEDTASSLSLLRSTATAAGLPTPYIALMARGDAATAWKNAQKLGCDAISSYTTFSNPNNLAGAP